MQAKKDVLKKIIIILCSLFLLSGYLTKDEAIYQAAQKGNTYYKSKKYAQAAQEYMRGLKIDSTNQVLNYNLANALYQLGKYKEAVSYYAKSPKDARTFENIGNSFKRLGDAAKDINEKVDFYKKALASYKHGIRKAPSDLELKYNYEYLQKLLKQLNKKQQSQNKNQQQNKQKDKQKNMEQKQKDNSTKDNKNNGNDQKSNSEKNKQNGKKKQGNSSHNQNQQNKNGKQNNQNAQNQNTAKNAKNKPQATNSSKQKIDPQKFKEAMGVLKLLEKNEKDDLKNNQRFRVTTESNDKYDW